MRYARMYGTKSQALRVGRNAIKHSPIIKRRGYVVGKNGGHIPISQAQITAMKVGKVWYPIARRK